MDKLKEEIEKHYNLEEIKDKCIDKKIFIQVCFYLWDGSKQPTRVTKDVDNLLKLLLDILCEYINNERNMNGLGIIKNDRDIFKIQAEKIIVNSKTDEGFKIEMSEYSKN